MELSICIIFVRAMGRNGLLDAKPMLGALYGLVKRAVGETILRTKSSNTSSLGYRRNYTGLRRRLGIECHFFRIFTQMKPKLKIKYLFGLMLDLSRPFRVKRVRVGRNKQR